MDTVSSQSAMSRQIKCMLHYCLHVLDSSVSPAWRLLRRPGSPQATFNFAILRIILKLSIWNSNPNQVWKILLFISVLSILYTWNIMKPIWNQHALNRPSNLSSHAPANLPLIWLQGTRPPCDQLRCANQSGTRRSTSFRSTLVVNQDPSRIQKNIAKNTGKECSAWKLDVDTWYIYHMMYMIYSSISISYQIQLTESRIP